MKQFINNEFGYHIEIAKNATQALMMLYKREYNLIITKRDIPESTLYDFVNSIRDYQVETNNPDLKIIAISGKALIEEQKEIMNTGVDLFLKKPYTKKELFKTIKKALD